MLSRDLRELMRFRIVRVCPRRRPSIFCHSVGCCLYLHSAVSAEEGIA
uniref:Uncharacterized protein n=1 Tax=Podoviridae sp. ct4s49 TaxID=2823555 RepID=A0A8S5LEF9_9CAUD|nr:MAG TPA: hypothetical protein [Podoviridae sp. ct4s49]